jgi:hypothetical protein
MRGCGITNRQGATFVMPARVLFMLQNPARHLFERHGRQDNREDYQRTFYSAFLMKVGPH